MAVWTDSRLGTDATGRQYIFAAAYEPAPEPALARAPVIGALPALAMGFAT